MEELEVEYLAVLWLHHLVVPGAAGGQRLDQTLQEVEYQM